MTTQDPDSDRREPRPRDPALASEMAEIGRRARARRGRPGAGPGRSQERGAAWPRRRACAPAKPEILAANARDLAEAAGDGLAPALRDRLALDPKRLEAIAAGLEAIAACPTRSAARLARWTRPNGLDIARVAVPLGVIGIIYESRPNVTADAGGLALKSGNAAILRGGSESFHSSRALVAALVEGAARGRAARSRDPAGADPRPRRGRADARHERLIDVIVPRGGRSLIERVQRESRIPVIAHLEGLCHTYVDGAADPAKARAIVLNAKMRRVSICGATETLLVDRAVAAAQLPPILADLRAAGCELRGDDGDAGDRSRGRCRPSEEDWRTEYLDAILSVRDRRRRRGAIAHVNRYGSHHTDAIVTEDAAAAERFLREVDSAIVLVNASTQFADGGEFGMGAEIGISTQRLPPRGPVGAEQLTTYKYLVRGSGQVRP